MPPFARSKMSLSYRGLNLTASKFSAIQTSMLVKKIFCYIAEKHVGKGAIKLVDGLYSMQSGEIIFTE